MAMPRSFAAVVSAAVSSALLCATVVRAEGEADGSFPSWTERWVHQLINRARCDPQADLVSCSECPDAPCYSPMPPLAWKSALNRAARFHSAEMTLQGFFSHRSACTVVSNISSLYPSTCDGDASCACVGGTRTCAPTCTSAQSRVGLFGSSYGGEIIARTSYGPSSAFYLWLHEPTDSDVCTFTQANGHRWLILTETGAVGVGYHSSRYTGDFGSGTSPGRIPSGSHYPQTASSVELWANWYDASGPSAAAVNIEGTCHPMDLERGSSTNGAWMAQVSGVGGGCFRYYFEFQDDGGATVTYPSTGSLAIGVGDGCPDWTSSRPPSCLAGGTAIFSDSFESGDTRNWSSTAD